MRLKLLLAMLALAATACGQIVTLEPPKIELVPRVPPEQSIVYDADGNQLAILRSEYRDRVALGDLPGHLVDAVITAEDRRFRVHAGVDARSLARAIAANVAAGEAQQGGSTITQQLVKNLYMPDADRTPETKVREAILARELEKSSTKDEILEEYVNTVYFGSRAYGIEAAAQTYFGVAAQDLDLAQAALLAAIIRSPEGLNPGRVPEAARQRRDIVLDQMLADGLIDAATAERTKARPVAVLPPPPSPAITEPHWVDYIVRTLLADPNFADTEAQRAQLIYGGGLRIHTTLDPDLQAKARAAAVAAMPNADDPEIAIVSVDPATGRVVAAAGNRAYDVLQFDLPTQATRQPGSTFKAFVLAAAVINGYGPDHMVNGNQGRLTTPTGATWTVRNYARASYGQITLEEATRASVNGAYARLALDLGIERVVATAKALGVESPINSEAPVALGGLDRGVTPLDMAAAYATLANGGQRVPASPIDNITGADGAVIFRPDRTPRPVLDPSAAFVVTQMLRTVVEDGTGTAARVNGWEVAGKTGTVQDYVDAWFVGYTPVLSTAVWIGHHEARIPLRWIKGVRTVTGGSLPASAFRAYMTAALEGREPVGFILPQEYYQIVQIDPVSGLLAQPWCPGEEKVLPRAIVPRDSCPRPPAPPAPTVTASPACSEAPPAADGTVTPCPTPEPGDPTPTPSVPMIGTGGGTSGDPSPTATPEPSPSPSPQPSPSPSPSPQPSPSPSPSPSPAAAAGGGGGTTTGQG